MSHFLNPKGHPNIITGSKVTSILLNGWILPIGGASSGRVCSCSLRSRVVSKTDSVFIKEDTQKCVFNNTCPRACISQYNPMGVYWLVQALGHVLCNTHSWASSQRMYIILGLGSFSDLHTSPCKSFCQDAIGKGRCDAVPYCHTSK